MNAHESLLDAEYVAALVRDREAFRIEADCAMRDYDALELEAGIMCEALEKIARTVGIVTRVSDGVALRTAPEYTGAGAQRIAAEALAQLKVTPTRASVASPVREPATPEREDD